MSIEILTFIVSVIVAVVALITWWEQHDHVYVTRIESSNDKSIQSLIVLYADIFSNDHDYDSDLILELVSEDIPFTFGRHVHIENIILVAKLKNEVIGFIFCHFYPHRRKAMVSYFGINKNRRCACQKASEKLLEQLRNILFTDDRCDFLFFDLQGVEPSLPSKEQAHRKSRITLFKQRAKEQGLEAYQFIFNYKCPKIYTDRYEHPFVLMCVPIKGSLPLRVPKKNND